MDEVQEYLYKKLFAAADKFSKWGFDDLDAEADRDWNALRQAIGEAREYEKTKENARRAAYAAMQGMRQGG